jgi:predicted HicB family RNase H-like nuclease
MDSETNNFMTYKGYKGSIEFSRKDNCYFGTIQGIKSLISYEGQNLEELKDGFHYMTDDYLETCKKLNIDPEIPNNQK